MTRGGEDSRGGLVLRLFQQPRDAHAPMGDWSGDSGGTDERLPA